MQRDDIFLIVAIIIVGFSFFNLVATIGKMTGYVADTGTANLTVESQLSINFTTDTINWGSGRVDYGETSATLDSEGTKINGNWTAVTAGLVLENIGNVNVTVDLKTGEDASEFIGGTNPTYEWKVSNNESASCTDGNELMDSYTDVNKSDARFCGQFSSLEASNQLEININITIPEDSIRGALGDTITATATTA